jgi:hypothetical protein
MHAAAHRVLALLLVALWPTVAAAHKPSDSYLALSMQGEGVVGQWDIALRDLDYAIGLDADADGAITWGEVKAKRAEIVGYAMSRLAVAADGSGCPTKVGDLLIDNHSDGAYVVLRFSAACPTSPSAFSVRYRLFFDLDPQHRGLLRLEAAGTTVAAVFAPATADQTFTLSSPRLFSQFLAYLGAGVTHIWTGYDHMLFLLSLLLPAVVARNNNRWTPSEGFRASFLEVVKVVSAFTLAHSITLGLATFGVVSLPARVSESAIAASVVLAALNNLVPVVGNGRWLVAFGFGLIHGFGFANVLADLGLTAGALALALVGFNLGVELGQIVIVGAFLPLAYFSRRTTFYRRFALMGGSSAIAAVAALWFVERAFDLKLVSVG